MTFKPELVDQLQAELKFSRVESCRYRAEVAGAKVGADAAIVIVTLELGVVPGVEGFDAELDTAPALLAEYKTLKE